MRSSRGDVDLQGEVHLLRADVCFSQHTCILSLDLAADSHELIVGLLFSATFGRKHFLSPLAIINTFIHMILEDRDGVQRGMERGM